MCITHTINLEMKEKLLKAAVMSVQHIRMIAAVILRK